MTKKLFLSFVFICSLFATNWIVGKFALNSFNVLQVEGTFPDQSKIFFRNANGFHPILSETTLGQLVPNNRERQIITYQLSNRLVSKFHLEISHGGSPFELDRISLYSFFSNQPLQWRGQEIDDSFDRLENQSIQSTTFDLRGATGGKNVFFSWGIAVLIASLVTTIIAGTQWHLFPAIQDTIEGESLRGENNISVLDGLRGLAALLVLFHHAGSSFPGSGALGVWLFFVLSGFLLTRNFIVHPDTSAKADALLRFVRRRFNRIVPLYFSFIVVVYLFPGHLETAVRHFLFIQGDGHLWTIIHEMYFYLMLPVIGWGIAKLGPQKIWLSICLLLCIALSWRLFGSAEILGIYALGIKARVYFEVFLIGMVGSCLYFGLLQNILMVSPNKDTVQRFAGWLGMLLLLVVSLLSLNLFDFTFHQLSRKFPVVAAFLALGLLLAALSSSQKSIYRQVLQHPGLRYVGVIGYSFYLLHPTILFMLQRAVQHFLNVPPQNISQIWWITLTTIFTMMFASFTYSFIERPFLRKQ